MKVKLGATQWGLPGDGWFAVQLVKEVGLDGLQLELGSWENGLPLNQPFIQECYREAGKEMGIEFPSIVANDLNKFHFLAETGTEKSEICYQMLEALIQTAAAMEIKLVIIPSFMDAAVKNEADFIRTAAGLRYASDLAEKYGVKVAHESALSAREECRLLDMTERDVKIFYDSRNQYFYHGYDQAEMLKDSWEKMASQLHVKDGIRETEDNRYATLMGEGKSGFYEVAEYLKKQEFEGWIITENMYSRFPLNRNFDNQMDALRKDVETMKRLFKSE